MDPVYVEITYNIVTNNLLQVLEKYGTEWIQEIRDVTDFVGAQYEHVKINQLDSLMVPEERVYPITNSVTENHIKLDTVGQ